MRPFLAVFMMLHGLAHLVGFAGSWQLGEAGKIPYKTTILAGHLDLGGAGIRAFGVLWLVAAIAFAAVAIGAFAERSWWMTATWIVACASLALTLLELPEARIGVAANLAILGALVLGMRTGWL